MTAPERAVPVAPEERVGWLDVLRGVAVLGILPANAPSFAIPTGLLEDPAPITRGTGEKVVFFLTKLVIETKFITIFSFLFGAGLMLLVSRAEAAGRAWKAVVVRRLLFLWAVGVAHVAFVWYGDILSTYAPVGLALVWLSPLSVKWLQRIGVGLIVLPIVGLAALTAAVYLVENEPWFVKVHRGFAEHGAVLTPDIDAPLTNQELRTTLERWNPVLERRVFAHGSFAQIAIARLLIWGTGIMAIMLYFGWRIAGLFLLGMAWTKDGWLLDPKTHRDRFLAMVKLGLLFGAPLQVLASVADMKSAPISEKVLAELVQYVATLGMAAAYIGAIGLLVGRTPTGRIATTLASVGRMAFTNYLTQSAIGTILFVSYGLGHFGRVDRVQLCGLIASLWLAQLAWSPLWLRSFRMGPLEWLWRAVSYGKLAPLRV